MSFIESLAMVHPAAQYFHCFIPDDFLIQTALSINALSRNLFSKKVIMGSADKNVALRVGNYGITTWN
jgi:hypothetical protein